MKRVNVEVWSDFVCPWCWIAKRRLEKAVNSLSGEIEVAVTHKAYRLARGMAPEDLKLALFNKFGSHIAATRMMEAVAANGAMEGLTYNFGTMRFGDTTDAHVLVKSVVNGEVKSRLVERLFAASTTEGLDIFDRDVLLGIAKSVGIPDRKIAFDDNSKLSEIAHEERAINSIGSGVPLFIFNGKSYLSGAREAEAFQKALLQTAVHAAKLDADSDAPICGIDGCRI